MSNWKIVAAIILGTGILLGLLVMLFTVVAPDQASSVRLDEATLLQQAVAQGRDVTSWTTIRPVLDAILLVTSYVLVCLIRWSQRELTKWVGNHRHFL